MSDDWQRTRAEALHAALVNILGITVRFIEDHTGTYHNAIHDVYSVACAALNADAEAGPWEIHVTVSRVEDDTRPAPD